MIACSWNRSRVLRALASARTVSLDAPLTSDGHALGAVLEDKSIPRADAYAATNDMYGAVRAAVAQLEPRMRLVIEHRFGLTTNGATGGSHRRAKSKTLARHKNPCALRAVGAVFGLTGERTRQIERAALLTLRRLLARDEGPRSAEQERRELESRLLARFNGQRIVVLNSFAESGLWFAAHRLTQRGLLRPGPCANTWLLARPKDKPEFRLTA